MSFTFPQAQLVPIEYSQAMEVRFDDLDPYGHVNASKYLDYVASARFIFAKKHLNFSAADATARGYGWYLIHADSSFKKAIVGLGEVMVHSRVARVEKSKFIIDYELTSPDGVFVHSTGCLTYLIIDLKTNRTTELPEWLVPIFFKPVAETP